MHSACSVQFRDVVRSVSGMTNDRPEGLLTSLPSELCFNDVRDASRRHTKQQKCAAHNIHTVCAKSAQKRSMGCETLKVTPEDWGMDLPQKSLKASVFASTRQTDVSLGISSEGLTKHKQSNLYTKPHKFCERLDMFLTLRRLYEEMGDEASAEDKRHACIDAFKNSWISKLVPQLWLFAFAGHENDDIKTMVLRAGPFNLLCIHLKACEDGSLVLAQGRKTKPFTVLVTEMQGVLLAKVEPCVGGSPVQLLWKATTPWMDIPHCIAEYGILTIANTLLSRVCSKLKLAGHTKLDHYYRVELFLKHLGTPQERIEEILALLPPKRERKKKEEEQDLRVTEIEIETRQQISK